MLTLVEKLREKIQFTPAQFIMISFVGLSLFGGIILMLPISNMNGEWRDFVASFFMSVSAVCVTGLVVADIGKDFTLFGQSVLLILMQIGGLSYMTITTILMYMIGKKLSFSDTKIFDLSNNSDKKINFTDFVIKIGVLTFIIEIVGMLCLLPDAYKVPYKPGAEDLGWFQALFHSVSAFCNAGMSMYSNSLEGFRDNYWVLFVFSLLPIIGGLGYTVLTELVNWFNSPSDRPKPHLSFHTKVCLTFTGSLLVIGVVIQLLLVYFQDLPSLNYQDFGDKFWVSFFQTVAARSSGFNSIPLHELGDPSLLLLIIWMMIGACPGGTGGGFKVTTLAVIFAMIYAALRNDKDVNLLNRSVNNNDQKKALTAFVATILLVIICTWLIAIFESGDSGLRFVDKFFEVTSAFTTVGLSTGITGQLSDPSLIVLCFCMLVGRPGPLLFLMALIDERRYQPARLPEEGILIG